MGKMDRRKGFPWNDPKAPNEGWVIEGKGREDLRGLKDSKDPSDKLPSDQPRGRRAVSWPEIYEKSNVSSNIVRSAIDDGKAVRKSTVRLIIEGFRKIYVHKVDGTARDVLSTEWIWANVPIPGHPGLLTSQVEPTSGSGGPAESDERKQGSPVPTTSDVNGANVAGDDSPSSNPETRRKNCRNWVPPEYRTHIDPPLHVDRTDLQGAIRAQFSPDLSRRKSLVTLTGSGGGGKSHAAVACARELAASCFRDGFYFVDLHRPANQSPVSNREDMAAAIGRGIGSTGTFLQPDFVLKDLEFWDCLLVLDGWFDAGANEPAQSFITEIADNAPSIAILATGRTRLGIDAEHPISADSYRLTPDEAMSMFVNYARVTLGNPSWSPDDDQKEAIGRIVVLADLVPLSIQLAAGWVVDTKEDAGLSLIVSDLENSPLGMTTRTRKGKQHVGHPDQTSLRAMLDWSFNRLKPNHRRFFVRFATLPQRFSVENVVAATRQSEEQVRKRLSELRRVSLIQQDQTSKPYQYFLPRHTQAYLVEKLDEVAVQWGIDKDAMEEELARRCLSLAKEAAPLVKKTDEESRGKVDELEAEIDTLVSALAWCVEHDPVGGLTVSNALHDFWWVRGWGVQGAERTEALLEELRDSVENRSLWSKGASVAGHLQRHLGNLDAADRWYQESETALDRNDHAGLAAVLRHRGILAWHREDWDGSRDFFDRALKASTECGQPKEVAESHYQLGNLFRYLGHLWTDSDCLKDAEDELKLSLVSYEEAKLVREAATARLALGNVTMDRGQDDDARGYYEKGLDVFDKLKDKSRLALIFERIAAYAQHVHSSGPAVQLLGQADSLRRDIGTALPNPDRQEYYDALTASLRQSLENDFQTRFDEGAALSLEDAVEVARQELVSAQ